ncbi:hypothetical protein JMJ55_27880 [Belnapia sp. T6]|uniref:Uncharacterized protein n=1 Tax=Belnapia mucosa TaxID=2804532 RepID=A0ABS1VBU4_9PROT|nr:hypothetical protein [Belnapia mucosa]MBL6459146.1 hypothetical protein [Belnapia mucosa]
MARRLALTEAVVVVSGPGQGCQMPDQRNPAGDYLELLAQSRWRADHVGFQRKHGRGARLDGGVTDDLEGPDHLHLTGAGFGQSRGLPLSTMRTIEPKIHTGQRGDENGT